MTATPGSRSTGFLVALAVLLALFHAILAVTATVGKSMTADEIAYLTAGHAYNTRGDFRLQPENGNLPQRWAALPALFAGVSLPATTSEAWRHSDVWNYGHEFFYEQTMPADELLFWGRGMIALFSAATGLLVFGWSRSLFGWHGGFFALILFIFCPSFLAHGALTTSDVPMTFFFLAAVGAWWRHLEHPGPGGAGLSALTLGLACLTKFSAVLLAPMFALLAAIWLTSRVRTDGWWLPLARLVRSTILHLAVTGALVWIFYGGRFSAFAPALTDGANFYRGDWNWILTDIGWLGPIVKALRNWHALPEAFLYGFTFVVQFARERSAFLNGEYSFTGWPSFFPFAFLAKTTVPLLLLLATGLAAWVHRLRMIQTGGINRLGAQLRRVAPLLVLFAVYWFFSVTSHLNIGHRHLLPTYPVLFILLGALATLVDRRQPAAFLLVAGLSLWHIGESWIIRPHYLAYFNQLVGGPRNGWRHLVDSSLDWGQDLPALRVWLDAHADGNRIFLSYFGSGDPVHEGIRASLLPTLPAVGSPRPWLKLTPGIYAISATMLSNVYSGVGGDWTSKMELEYQELRSIEGVMLDYARHSEKRAVYEQAAPADRWHNSWKRYEQLRFARLCYSLRVRTPDAIIGYSILIYRLDQRELDAAINGDLRQLAAAIEHALTAPPPPVERP